MLFYFLIWFCLFVFSLLEINNLQKEHSFFLFAISTFLLFFLSFVRWETGTDWDGYYEYFNHIFYYFQDSDFEFGFARINEIIKLTFGNYTILLFVFSCIIFFSRLKLYLNIHLYHCLVCFFCGPFLLQMFSIYDKLSLLLYCFIQQHFLLIKRRGCFLSVFISPLCFTQPRLYLSLPIFYSD